MLPYPCFIPYFLSVGISLHLDAVINISPMYVYIYIYNIHVFVISVNGHSFSDVCPLGLMFFFLTGSPSCNFTRAGQSFECTGPSHKQEVVEELR